MEVNGVPKVWDSSVSLPARNLRMGFRAIPSQMLSICRFRRVGAAIHNIATGESFNLRTTEFPALEIAARLVQVIYLDTHE